MEQRLKQIISSLLQIPENEIINESSMENVENWDSLKHIELLTYIEEKFDIKLETEEMIQMTNYEEIKRILRKKGIGI